MSKVFTTEQVEQQSTAERTLIIIEGGVYDVTDFLQDHPGGQKILVKSAGQDATEQFHRFHSASVLQNQAAPFRIGSIGADASTKDADDHEEDEDTTYFGDLVPFGDPFWYQDWQSPYYKDSHRKLRTAVRKFTDKNLTPNALAWDQAREIPVAAYKQVADAGILAGIASGSAAWISEYAEGVPIPGNVPAEEWDAFHAFILLDEMCRCASGGIMYGIVGGFGIGLPPVLHFGSDELKQRIVPPCVKGEKRICLAITEPEGGSDVANLVTTATLSNDKTHYIVNGRKKWVTQACYADYFVTAVRTGGKGMGGLSLIVVERGPGVTTTKMDCMGVWGSGTTFVEFDEVKVPVGNLLGKENKGFALIMSNFNPERLGIAVQANRFARCLLEESIKYSSKRSTFGIKLREHPVIRAKLSNMAMKIESTHAWIESVIYQSTCYDADTLTMRGGGTIALLKAQATETFEFCAREASQIFGGLSYTRGGQGEKVERLYRDVKAYTIPGGSSEIMLDLAMRQSIKVAEIMGAKL